MGRRRLPRRRHVLRPLRLPDHDAARRPSASRHRAGSSLDAFWGRRARRLLPALFLLLVVVVLYGSATMSAAPARGPAGRRAREPLLRRQLALHRHRPVVLRPAHPALAAPAPLVARDRGAVLPGVAVGRGRRPGARAAARAGRSSCVTVAGIVVSQIFMVVLYDEADPSRAYYGTEARAHTLLVGCLLALMLLRRLERRRAPRRRAVSRRSASSRSRSCCSCSRRRPRARGCSTAATSSFAVLVAVVIAAAVQPLGVLRRVPRAPPAPVRRADLLRPLPLALAGDRVHDPGADGARGPRAERAARRHRVASPRSCRTTCSSSRSGGECSGRGWP